MSVCLSVYLFPRLGSVLGNPKGLLQGISGGVVGLVGGGGDTDSEDESDDEGVDVGALMSKKSKQISGLIGTTVGGVAGSVKGITGGVASLAAGALTDEKYQRERMERQEEEAQTRNRGSVGGNLARGFFGGLKNVVGGVTDGVVGLVEKPMEGISKGAEKDGVGGAIKGFGKGLFGGVTGLVSKVIAGACLPSSKQACRSQRPLARSRVAVVSPRRTSLLCVLLFLPAAYRRCRRSERRRGWYPRHGQQCHGCVQPCA